MNRYALNSAVLTAFGTCEYEPLNRTAARDWWEAGPVVATIGYEETKQRWRCSTSSKYRLLLAGMAYTLLETMRRTALRGTGRGRSQCHSLRVRLLRIAAVVTRSTRTVAVRLSGAYPDQAVFRLLVQRLTAG